MNNTFDIQRFSLLLKRKWLEFGKIYLVILVVAFGVMLIAYLMALWPLLTGLSTHLNNSLIFREPFFFIFGFLFITAVASSYFSHLGQKPKTIIDLLIPASTFEKFIAGIFFTAILTTVSFVALFFLTDLVFVAKLRTVLSSVEKATTYTEVQGTVTVIKDQIGYFFVRDKPSYYLPLYVAPLLVTSIFLLGSIYFNKFHYMKTALSVMVFAGVWALTIVKTGQYLTEGRHLVNYPGGISYNPGKETIAWLFALLLFVVTLVIWTITFVRLKEKEV